METCAGSLMTYFRTTQQLRKIKGEKERHSIPLRYSERDTSEEKKQKKTTQLKVTYQ